MGIVNIGVIVLTNKHIFFSLITLFVLNLLLYTINYENIHRLERTQRGIESIINSKVDNLASEIKSQSERIVGDLRISNIEADVEELKLQYKNWDREWLNLFEDSRITGMKRGK